MALLAVYYFPQAPGLPVAQKWACGTSYRGRGVLINDLIWTFPGVCSIHDTTTITPYSDTIMCYTTLCDTLLALSGSEHDDTSRVSHSAGG